MKSTKRILKMILYTLIVLIVCLILFLNIATRFGGSAKGESLEKIKKSKNFNGNKFVNLVPTKMITDSSSMNLGSMMEIFFPPKEKVPQLPLPSKIFNKNGLINDSFTWLGHSTILMKTNNITIITDPVFYRASPIPGITRPFKVTNPATIKDLPKIDIILISHDHYDHLDYKAIKELAIQVDLFLVPLGVKAHLLRWGVEDNKIIEKNWYENSEYKDINFTFTPTRHFTGRGITNRDSTLWGAWIVKSDSLNIYYGGDSGYFNEFKKIGNEYGSFDIAFLENGAYNKGWAQAHMFPEETVQASIDLRAKVLFPIHWAKFDLAYHNWDDPIIRVTSESEKKNVTVATPLIGEIFNLKELPQTKWWENLNN